MLISRACYNTLKKLPLLGRGSFFLFLFVWLMASAWGHSRMAFAAVIFTSTMWAMVRLGSMKHLMRCKMLRMFMVKELFALGLPNSIFITMSNAVRVSRVAGLPG